MKTKFFASVLLSVLINTGLTSAQSGGDKWLTVEVRDSAGQPLGRACVTLVPREGEILFSKADKRGVVRFKKPAAGQYRVIAKVEGYEAQKREVASGERMDKVAFALQPRPN